MLGKSDEKKNKEENMKSRRKQKESLGESRRKQKRGRR